MIDLERELRSLQASVEFPPTPDLAPAVRRRIAGPFPAAARRRRSWALAAVALLLTALGATLAVPSARTALFEWLGIGGVSVTRVETAPTAPLEADLGLGERVSLDQARERVEFPLALPRVEGHGRPDEIAVATLAHGVQVAFLWRGSDGAIELLLTRAGGSFHGEFARKLAGPATTIEQVSVNGRPALWLAGEPHAFAYVAPDGTLVEETLRLAANTLLWERGSTTYRLEGDLTREEALRIARLLERS